MKFETDITRDEAAALIFVFIIFTVLITTAIDQYFKLQNQQVELQKHQDSRLLSVIYQDCVREKQDYVACSEYIEKLKRSQ